MSDFAAITVVILSGGRGRRVGGQDKGLLPYHGRPVIEHVLAQVPASVHAILISANRNAEQYARYGQVVPDLDGAYSGPLMGVLSALAQTTTPLLLTLPCDVPALPADLVERLHAALIDNDADLAVVSHGGHKHYVIALMKTALAQDLRDYLDQGGRRVGEWQARHRVVAVDYADPDLFRNLNTDAEFTR